jgi:ribose transport system ATP-binding protein
VENHLQMQGISVYFGGVRALQNAHFEAFGGEVHALMGENGAGKSTLMKVLAGAYRPDHGSIVLDGQRLAIDSPHAARGHGISMIYQEFSLAKHLSVAENIFLDNLAEGGWRIDRQRLDVRAREALEQIGFGHLDVRQPVASLSVAQQQVIEICKALAQKPRVLVFDEPTAVLTEHESERLFELIAQLRNRGVCIIYISHRLEEVYANCQRVTVLKDGQVVATRPLAGLSQHELVHLMIGRELNEMFPPRKARIGAPVLEVRGLQAGPMVQDVSFTVHEGEVLGLSGLVGSGRTEALRAVFGADRLDAGEVRLDGRLMKAKSPRDAVNAGIGMLPEDRKHQGVLLDLSVRINAMLRPRHPYAGWLGRIDKRRETADVGQSIIQLGVKTASMDHEVGLMSGGNQQKVALLKWVGSNCRVLVLDEPTRGVDVGAKVEIYRLINALCERGIAIVLISSEMPEVIGMSDRVLVMRQGRVAGEVHREQLTEKSLIQLAMGLGGAA